jgi:ABC-type enterochelin transport system permease subunit
MLLIFVMCDGVISINFKVVFCELLNGIIENGSSHTMVPCTNIYAINVVVKLATVLVHRHHLHQSRAASFQSCWAQMIGLCYILILFFYCSS